MRPLLEMETMGDTTDGSSSAAHSAQPDPTQQTSERGFFGRIVEALSPSDTPADVTPVTGYAPSTEVRGMINLRNKRGEDVMIPKVDVTAVPSTISRDDLVQVFRDSGQTRLPVFEGTLDTPIGFVHMEKRI